MNRILIKRPIIYLLILYTTLSSGCTQDEILRTQLDERLIVLLKEMSPSGSIDHFQLPDSDNYNEIPQDSKNPLTKDKVALGKMLFHETALAINAVKTEGIGTYSCASCHNSKSGFHSGRIQGIAEGGLGIGLAGESRNLNPNYQEDQCDAQPIRVPSNLNAMYQEVLLWNGLFGGVGVNIGTEDQWEFDEFTATNKLGFHGLETQAIAGLKFHRMGIEENFIRATGYKKLFDLAFPEIIESERYSRHNAGLAIAAYERTLISNKAPFQMFLRGNMNAMSKEQKEGAILFFGKGKCVECHSGPALNSMSFKAIGMSDLDEQSNFINTVPGNDLFLGRGSFTRRETDYYKFKVPQLYNLLDVHFFGHGSSMNNLVDVINYKNRAIAENNRVPSNMLDEKFKPLNLTHDEVNSIVDFLAFGCYDPDLRRYVPERIVSGNCFPNNDLISRTDLGCN